MRPVALGSTIRLRVYDHFDPAVLTQASSSNPGVLALDSLDYDLISLKAISAGTSRITARTSTLHDTLDVEVVPIASRKLEFEGGIATGPWAMAPYSTTWSQLWHYDAAGRLLAGFGADPIGVGPTYLSGPPQYSDSVLIDAQDTIGATVELRAGPFDYTLETVDPANTASLKLAPFETPGVVPQVHQHLPASFTVPVSSHYYVLDAYLADGRFLVSKCPDFAFDASGNPGLVQLDAAPDPQNDGRVFKLAFAKPGTASFSLTCLGRTVSYTATITAQ